MSYSTRVADQLRGQSPMSGLDRRKLAPVQVFAQSVSGAAPAAAMAVIPAIVAASAGVATIWSIAVAIGLALLIASCIGRFTKRMAVAGSLYSLTAKGLGSRAALLCGSGLLIGYGLLSMASFTGAAMMLGTLATRIGMPPAYTIPTMVVGLLVVAALVTACAVRGVRLSAAVILLVEALSIGLMLVVFGTLLVSQGRILDSSQLLPSTIDLGAVAVGVLPAMGAFIGFETATAMGVEARRPFAAIPRAVTRTAALTGVLSLFAAYTQVAGFATVPGGLAAQPDPVPTLAAAQELPWLSIMLDAGVGTSFLACALATTTALVRLLLSAGREHVVPAWLGHTHPRFRTPHLAIAVTIPVTALVPAVLLACGIVPNRALSTMLTTSAVGYLLAYLLVCLAAPVFLHRIGELTVTAVVATSVIVPVLLAVLIAFAASSPPLVTPVVAGAVLLVALTRYLWLRLRNPERIRAIGLYDETSAADLLRSRL